MVQHILKDCEGEVERLFFHVDPLNTWERPRAGDTLESIVDQARGLPPRDDPPHPHTPLPWLDQYMYQASGSASTRTMDSLVPCFDKQSTCLQESSTRVEYSESHQVKRCENDHNLGSPESRSSCKPPVVDDDHDNVSYRTSQTKAWKEEEKGNMGKCYSSLSKRSRATAAHNQSERKRRENINQKMKALQRMLPNCSCKTDKASTLDNVIAYTKKLQAQVKMMSSIQHMSIEAQMSNSMGMEGMDMMNTVAQAAGISSMLHPAAGFLPSSWPWGGMEEQVPPSASIASPGPFSSFLASQKNVD